MSEVRRSSRLAAKSTPSSSTVKITPKNSITRYGVKSGLKNNNDATSKSENLLVEEKDSVETPQSEVASPKKKKQIIFSPLKFDYCQVTTPTTTSKSANTNSYHSPTSSIIISCNGLETPKSTRSKLFDQDESKENSGLLVSTPKSPKTIQSGFGSQQRIALEGYYARLKTPIKVAANYQLPKKYQPLYDVFERMDRVIAHKKQRCRFEELKKTVDRNFTKDIFAQILTVYPNSYTVKLEEHQTFGTKTLGQKYDLIIEPNLKKDLESYWKSPSPKKQLHSVNESPAKLISVIKSPPFELSPRTSANATPKFHQIQLINGNKLDHWRMECRKAIFKYKLLLPIFELDEQIADEFKALNIDNDYLHKNFKLQSPPAIAPSKLPQPFKETVVQTKLESYLVGKKSVLPVDSVEALPSFTSPQKKIHTSPNGKMPSPNTFSKLSIQERTLLKQKAREAKLEPMRVAKERKRNQLEFINQKLLYYVFYRVKPQTIVKLDAIVCKLAQDMNRANEKVTEHIKLLCECAHTYFIIITVGTNNTKYLRSLCQAESDYQNIAEIIEKEFKKYQ